MFPSVFGVDVEEVTFYKVMFPVGVKYQTLAIAPGVTATVYIFRNWGQDFRAFVERIGIGPDDLPWNRVRFVWKIDGEIVEDYDYQIAGIRKPKQFDEPFVARTEIVWEITNDDTETHVFEVLCDGSLVMKPESKVRYGV